MDISRNLFSYDGRIEGGNLILKDLSGEKTISPEDIISVSSMQKADNLLYYEVLTPNGKFNVNPTGIDFENSLTKIADLLFVGQNLMFSDLKRWSKRGMAYQYTSDVDKIQDAFYGQNTQSSKIFRLITIGGFFVISIILIISIFLVSLPHPPK